MTYRLEIRPDVFSDIEEAAVWYDEQRAGLGSEFTREVVEAIDALSNNPLMYRVRTNERTFVGSYSKDFLTALSTELQGTSLRS